MKTLKNKIELYLKKRNWHNNKPSDLAKSISIEAAELLEIFQWKNFSTKELKKNKEKLESLQEEVADLFIYLFGMSVSVEFDPEKVILGKLEKLEKKYPPNLVKNNQKNYYSQKEKYRNHSK